MSVVPPAFPVSLEPSLAVQEIDLQQPWHPLLVWQEKATMVPARDLEALASQLEMTELITAQMRADMDDYCQVSGPETSPLCARYM